MNKKGVSIIVIILIVLIILVVAAITWKILTMNNEPAEPQTGEQNQTNQTSETNTTIEQNQTNQTTEPEPSDYVPNPTGDINWVDKSGAGGYYCNNDTSPEHQIKLYTYRLINGTRKLSSKYIESEKVEEICKYYTDAENGVNYGVEWSWTPVSQIDGYKIYQYYSYENVSREYDYSIIVTSTADKLRDTGLDLWRAEEQTNTTS